MVTTQIMDIQKSHVHSVSEVPSDSIQTQKVTPVKGQKKEKNLIIIIKSSASFLLVKGLQRLPILAIPFI